MSTPLLYVLAGPNGSGKSTFADVVLRPATGLSFVNADEIAAAEGSFIAETVFSHPSKVALVEQATQAGYRVELHVLLLPEDVAVARVAYRVRTGGHTVPPDKIRERYRRLWGLVAQARAIVHRATFYDNSRSRPFQPVAVFERGHPVGTPTWPAWAPEVLTV